jgi:galactosyltransferase
MRILIAILGCHARPAFRDAQRATWLRDLAGADYRYFLGRPAVTPGESDVVYLDCDDSYEKLTLKTHATMRWAAAEGYDWVFKCDDDTYVRPEQLLASNFSSDDYSGFVEGRWGEVISGCSQIVYAFAQGGAGYWVSRRAVAILADHLLVNEYCEDLAVAKTLALYGINPVHDARYHPQVGPLELEYPDARANLITLHKCSPQQMVELYRSERQNVGDPDAGSQSGDRLHLSAGGSNSYRRESVA